MALNGFNLDFESLKSSAGPHYVQFIREMSVSCRQKGLVLSVDDYVPAVYSAFYNRKEQGIVADYVIVMGYDEHFAGGDAGSVASISYVENGITGTLKEVPKEKTDQQCSLLYKSVDGKRRKDYIKGLWNDSCQKMGR